MPLAESTRDFTYSPTVSTSAYDVPFRLFDRDDLVVKVGGTATTSYSLTAVFVNGRCDDAVVTLVTGVSDTTVQLIGQRAPRVDSDYLGTSPEFPGKVLLDVERIAAVQQEQDRDIDAVDAAVAAIIADAPAVTETPTTQEVLVMADLQPLTATQADNTHGHDQVAVVQNVMDSIALAHPDIFALFINGDVVDMGGLRDDNAEVQYEYPDVWADLASRLTIGPDRIRMLWGNHDRNYGQYDGQFDGDTFNNARRALGPGHKVFVDGGVMHICMSDHYPGTQGAIPRHVRDWFKSTVRMGNAMLMPIFVHTHQPLKDIGLASADTDDGSQATSEFFKELLSEPGYGITAWFSGHVGGVDGETDNHVVFAGCHFFDVNLAVPGAYNAASDVPLWNLSYCKIVLTDGSETITIKRYDHTAAAYIDADEVTITHGSKVRLSNIPSMNGDWVQDRSGIIEGFEQDPVQIVSQHGKEPANKIDLGSNPLTTVSGDATVTVTHPAHGYSTGEEVNFSGMPSDLNGIPESNLEGPRQITVIDAGSYSFEAGAAATSSGSGASGSFATAEVQATVTEPHFGLRVVSWLMQGVHAVGMGAGLAVYIPYATGGAGAGPGSAEDVVAQRGFAGGMWGKLLNLSTRATSLVLSASTGRLKSNRVDVLELHPTEGAKDLINSFMFQRPAIQITEQNDVDLGAVSSPHYFAAMTSPSDTDIGGYYTQSDASIRGDTDGDVFGVSASVVLDGANDHTMELYFEHWDDSVGTTKTAFGKTNEMTIPFTPVQVGNGERVYLVISGHSGATTLDVTRVHMSAVLISKGN
ncbi:MAG: metallophosphoesterase family protein [Pikeienuella sp.]